MDNIYQPDLMEVTEIRQQTSDVKSVSLRFLDPARAASFTFRVGQFGIFSVFGYGESTFNICSSSNWKDHIEFCFRKVGRVTEALWHIEVGDTIGFRGPYGNGYPTESWKGRNLIFLGGGIAMPPIRCAVWYVLENRADYGDVTVVYGARTVGDLVYADELDAWAKYDRVRIVRCVDPGGETPDWKGEIGFVPHVFEAAKVESLDPVALVIGPPIMIKNTLPILDKMGVTPQSVYTSLENRMKCGLGKCGRCNVGAFYLCKEGPVLTMAQLHGLPLDY
jgi:sulfhydrogenase subunit gamma (sulfur reductase)